MWTADPQEHLLLRLPLSQNGMHVLSSMKACCNVILMRSYGNMRLLAGGLLTKCQGCNTSRVLHGEVLLHSGHDMGSGQVLHAVLNSCLCQSAEGHKCVARQLKHPW